MRRDCLKVTPISPLFMTAGVLRQIKCLCVCAVSLRMWNMLLFVIQCLCWTLSASYAGYDLDAVAYFGPLSHFPGFLLTWEKKSALAFIKDQFWFVWTLPSKGYAGVFGLGTAQVLYNQNFWHIFSNWHKFELRSHEDLCWAGFFVLADVHVGTVDWLNSGTTETNAEFWILMFLLKE